MTVEEYIKRYTKNCSNEISQWRNTIHGSQYSVVVGHHPWLAPDDARSVAKIAKEETINKAYEFIISDIWEYLTITHCGGVEGVKIDTDRFKKDFCKHMED